MTLRQPALLPPLLALALALAACAAAEPPDPPALAAEEELPPIPFCRDEMAAYVELIRLARSHGDGWTVFAPAMDALRRRILDCVDDTAARFRQLRLNPAPPPAALPACDAGCASARSTAPPRA